MEKLVLKDLNDENIIGGIHYTGGLMTISSAFGVVLSKKITNRFESLAILREAPP